MDNALLIKKYFPDVTDEVFEQFELLGTLYKDWNEKVNLISRKDIENLYTNHILHSLTIAHFNPFNFGERVLDVGTGGGFPGIPLAILFPKTQFVLVDSIQKKIKVVNEIAAALELKNVKAICTRAEMVDEKFEYVVSRAVTSLEKFMPWIDEKIFWNKANSGVLYLKGGDLTEELAQVKGYKIKTWELAQVFTETFYETKKLIHLTK